MNGCCRPKWYFWVLGLGVFALDQITKAWVLVHMPWRSIPVIPGFFNLTYVENTGVAFGLFTSHNFILGAIAVAFLAYAVYWARSLNWQSVEVNIVGAALVAGAAGNILDRFRHGFVVDFLDFYIGGWHWPAFNVADSLICVSVAWIFLRQLGWNPKKRRQD